MTFFKEGNNPQPGTPAADVQAFTFGIRLANGKVTPCTAQGQKAEFVFNDTVEAVENGFGVGLLSIKHSGGIGVPCLAGGVVAPGDRVGVAMVNFTINGVVKSLPVAKREADLTDGDWLVAKASLGMGATEADTDVNAPSLALEFLDTPMEVVGGEAAISAVTIPISLADFAANGDRVTWAPDFDGMLLSYDFSVTDPATTAAKTITLHPEINDVAVTGGVLVITSANATPLGNSVSATPITALNIFAAGDEVAFEAAAVTAFVEGAGVLIITISTNTLTD